MTYVRFLVLLLLLAWLVPGWASPCRYNSWQPTYVHDLTNPNDSGPYYVMPDGSFVRLTGDWTNQSGPGMCCLYGVRDSGGFTTCQDYTRVQCGCDLDSLVNDTCRRFLGERGVGNDLSGAQGSDAARQAGCTGNLGSYDFGNWVGTLQLWQDGAVVRGTYGKNGMSSVTGVLTGNVLRGDYANREADRTGTFELTFAMQSDGSRSVSGTWRQTSPSVSTGSWGRGTQRCP